MVNVENIDNTIDLIKHNEDIRLDMENWLCPNTYDAQDESDSWCGTVACIAGYGAISCLGLASAEFADSETTAREYFGLTDRQACGLFYPPCGAGWGITGTQAVQLLEHLRDTSEVDWRVLGLEGVGSLADDYEPIGPNS